VGRGKGDGEGEYYSGPSIGRGYVQESPEVNGLPGVKKLNVQKPYYGRHKPRLVVNGDKSYAGV